MAEPPDFAPPAGIQTALRLVKEAEAAASRPGPIAIVFPSKPGGDGTPHVVTVLPFDPPVVSCTCKAMLSLNIRPRGCWAMQAARKLLGIPEVGNG